MIDTNTRKGKMLASLIMGLAAAHGINDDPASQQVQGAVNVARLMMIAANKGWQRNVEQNFIESGSHEENMKALSADAPKEMETLLKSFSYEQLKDMMSALNCVEGLVETLQRTVQYAAYRHHPAQFRRDMEELGGEVTAAIHVIDLSGLFEPNPPHPPKPGMVS